MKKEDKDFPEGYLTAREALEVMFPGPQRKPSPEWLYGLARDGIVSCFLDARATALEERYFFEPEETLSNIRRRINRNQVLKELRAESRERTGDTGGINEFVQFG